ncbi:hypothetical protein BT96DRAFT_917811 [Gymnopus androsaceus JB14]|uniref:Uncharacterized protein n=1 Tax=Gymnopus androsaceus JB14 TaxID=1447944 RepID=A0A6A4I2L4_9AGAR|nr:hypothetical protein BT96DRAFT_917811 [Gymnopus androsaceus JB14]
MAKGKGKTKGNGRSKQSPQNPPPPSQCETLEEDEIIRCGEPAADGPRCKVHQAQYRTLYAKYKAAGKVVDETKAGMEMPSKEHIAQYSNLHSTLEKARRIRKYLEAIRVEKAGRDMHQKRFFAKADDGHKIRLKVLEKQMSAAVEILDAVQARAFDLHMADDPAREWVKNFQAAPLSTNDEEFFSAINSLESETDPQRDIMKQQRVAAAATTNDDTMDADLIDIEMRAKKASLLYVFEFVTSEEATLQCMREFLGPENANIGAKSSLSYHTLCQYYRRIVMHDPVLSLKAINKRRMHVQFEVLMDKRMDFGLLLWKDSIIEAMAITRSKAGTAANVGDPKNRFKVLGGWVFNTPHSGTMSNETWGTLLETLAPIEANIENRFVRLCNTFDDLITYLSFGALGLFPPPRFCSKTDAQGRDAVAPRNHLSLCGCSVNYNFLYLGHHPLRDEAGPQGASYGLKWRNGLTYLELFEMSPMHLQMHSYPDSGQDLIYFQVVLYSDTDSKDKFECFGSGNEALPAIQTRTFEGPPASVTNLPSGRGEWEVQLSASDLLFGTKQPEPGYLTLLTRPGSSGWFFHFKKMPVKYFVILDTVPHRHHSILAKHVAWTALCTHGFGEGEYSNRKYARASDVMFQKRAEELLSWKPKGSWTATKMGD